MTFPARMMVALLTLASVGGCGDDEPAWLLGEYWTYGSGTIVRGIEFRADGRAIVRSSSGCNMDVEEEYRVLWELNEEEDADGVTITDSSDPDHDWLREGDVILRRPVACSLRGPGTDILGRERPCPHMEAGTCISVGCNPKSYCRK